MFRAVKCHDLPIIYLEVSAELFILKYQQVLTSIPRPPSNSIEFTLISHSIKHREERSLLVVTHVYTLAIGAAIDDASTLA
jgi:hypothetical protein